MQRDEARRLRRTGTQIAFTIVRTWPGLRGQIRCEPPRVITATIISESLETILVADDDEGMIVLRYGDILKTEGL